MVVAVASLLSFPLLVVSVVVVVGRTTWLFGRCTDSSKWEEVNHSLNPKNDIFTLLSTVEILVSVVLAAKIQTFFAFFTTKTSTMIITLLF